MKPAVFVEAGKIELQERPIPAIGSTDALLRITTTDICGTNGETAHAGPTVENWCIRGILCLE